MKPSALYALLRRINELFPRPTKNSFKGQHHILLEDGVLKLGLWLGLPDGRVVHQSIQIADVDDAVLEDQLLLIKEDLDKKVALYGKGDKS